MQRFLSILLIGSMCLACGGPGAPEPEESAQTEASAAAPDDPSQPSEPPKKTLNSTDSPRNLTLRSYANEPRLRNDKALVQILLVGVMVFERTDSAVTAYLPRVPHHYIKLDQGQEKSGKPFWDNITLVGGPITNAWTLNIGSSPGALQAPQTLVDRNLPPQSERQARDSRWLLTATEVGGEPQQWDYKSAWLKVRLDTGVFETCGLVADRRDQPCKVTLGSADRPVVAESMVLRQVIDIGQTVKIGGYTIAQNPGAVVTLGDETFTTVYDIAIVNVPDESERQMTSDHSKYLAQMFKSAKGDWSEVRAYDCSSTSENASLSIPHPDCFHYFAKFEKRYSGFNRPICPMVEGP